MHGNSAKSTTAQTSLHAWDHLANWGRADRHLPQTGAEFEREKGTRETFMTAFRKGIFFNELAKQSVINEALASVCVLTVSIYFCGSHTNITNTHTHKHPHSFTHSHSQQFSRWSFATLPQITAHTWQRSNNNYNNDNKHDTLFHLGIWGLLSFICTSNTSINMCISVCVCVLLAVRQAWLLN